MRGGEYSMSCSPNIPPSCAGPMTHNGLHRLPKRNPKPLPRPQILDIAVAINICARYCGISRIKEYLFEGP